MNDQDLLSSVIAPEVSQTKSLVQFGLDENPDDAARAVDLSNATGVPASVVNGNLEQFDKSYQASLARGLVMNNPQLRSYVQSHPLAAAVSNDDWGTLDKFSQAATKTSSLLKAINAPWDATLKAGVAGAVSGFEEGFGAEPLTSQSDVTKAFPSLDPSRPPIGWFANLIATGEINAGEITARGMSGIFKAITQGVSGAAEAGYKAMGGDAMQASRFARDIGGMAEYQMMKPEAAEGSVLHGLEPAPPMDFAKTWMTAGKEPPRGVDPTIDKTKAAINAAGVERLDEDLANAQSSTTKERSPELFSKFVEQHYGTSTIAIDGNVAASLYGVDKVPTPDDGILGWVPGIADKLALARSTGADVEIPVKDWITHVDPNVAKALHDDIRIWPGGVTAREATENPTVAKPMVDAPMAQVRGAAGTEPVFSVGDRKLTLGNRQTIFFGASNDSFDKFEMLDQNGNSVGHVDIMPFPEKKQLYVSSIESADGLHPNTFGPSLMRDLLRQIKALYPDYETITGHRVTGARAGGVGLDEPIREISHYGPMPTPIVRLDVPNGWDSVETYIGARKTFEDNWQPIDRFGTEANIQPDESFTEHQLELGRVVNEEIEKITGAEGRAAYTAGLRQGGPAHGVFTPGMDASRGPWIVYDLLSDDPQGTARHEAIHWLYRQGLFTNAEWNVLNKAAETEGWQQRFSIDTRYPDANDYLKREESIAEGFREWMHNEEGRRVDTPVGRIFQKLLDFLNNVKDRFAKILGREPTFEDVFRRAASGEVGERGQGQIVGPGQPAFSVGEKTGVLVHGGRDFDDIDFTKLGTGERGGIRPLGKGLYGGMALDEKGLKSSIELAKVYAKKYGGFVHGFGFDLNDSRLAKAGTEFARGGLGEEVPGSKLLGGRSANQIEYEKLPWMHEGVNALEAAVHDPSILKRMGKWFADTPTDVIMQDIRRLSRAQGPAFSIDELDQLRANATGLDIQSYRRLQKLIQERYKLDVEKSIEINKKREAKEQTAEWKANEAEVRKEVESQIRQRPDVAADLFLGSGEFNGEKMRQRFTLRAEDLTPEQKALLPKHYVSANGFPADEIAKLFGYGSGDAMVEALGKYHTFKGDLSPQEALKLAVKSETARQMELRYGNLDENILDEAKDRALSENDLNILVEEYTAAGMQAGQPTIDKALIKSDAKDAVDKMTLAELSSDKLMAQMGKHGSDAERSLIAGDPATALQSLERKTRTAFMAAEARKVEKSIATFDKRAKQLAKRELKSILPEYSNYIHQVLMSIGKPVRRSFQGIQADIEARGTGTLREFADAKEAALRVLPVWDQLNDPTFRKEYSSLTVNEFKAVEGTVRALRANGMEELKVYKAGDAEQLEIVKGQLKSSLQRFKELAYDANGKRTGALSTVFKVPRGFLARALQIETLVNYWDKFDPKGAWNQYFMRDLVDGANQVDRWVKDYAAELKKLDDGADLSKNVANPLFRNPLREGGLGELMTFNRENLRRILLDAGNSRGVKSNLYKRAAGYGLKPEEVMSWLHQHATKEDWDWAQGIWDMWGTIKDKGDDMFRSLTGGVAPDDVVLDPIQTRFGTYRGGYYPTNDFHPLFEGSSAKLSGEKGLLQKNFTSATSPPGWSQPRTGYSAPLRNDLSNMANLMKSHLHDIAMRPGIINASKIVMDNEIKNAIKLHFGEEYAKLFRPYLEALANRTDYMSTHQAYANSWAEYLRQNLVTTLVGLNPGTVLKHGPTAFVMSVKEVGLDRYLKATRDLYSINEETGDSNKKFIDDTSLEVNRRSRNWQETLYGALSEQTPGNKFESLRQEIAKLSSKPVAFSDMLSTRPTWLAAYSKAVEEGETHGDAVYAADRAVRRAHGSTAITNRPEVMRNSNPWITSVYNFFNDILNRQLETLWRAAEAQRDIKLGDKSAAFKAIPAIAGGLFAYAIWPAIVEQLVSPSKSDPNDGLLKKMTKAVVFTESSTLPYVRDFAHFLIEGGDPSVGLVTTGYKELGNIYRDFAKNQPFSPAHAQRMIHDWAGLAGMLTGMVPQSVGNVAEFGYGVAQGTEHPRGPWGWLVGLRYGTLKNHSPTFDRYMENRK